MRICLFGGTFDPPHIGHLLIAQTVFEEENFDKIFFTRKTIKQIKPDIIFSFITAIKNYLKTRNIYQLSALIFILISLIPYLPSGSFYSSFNSAIFWVNYAIMMSYLKKED